MEISGGRFAITGGVSLIGSHITEALLSRGAEQIILFDNYSLSTPETVGDLLKNPRVRVVRGDILRIGELYDAFEGVQGVFSVAAFLTLPLSNNPALGLAVNVQGQNNVLEACRYQGVKKMVFSSSTAVYGEPIQGVMDETTASNLAPFQPAAALYSASKLIGEHLNRYYHQKQGLQTISLRYATVYGERQHYRGVNALYIVENYDRIKRGERPIIPDDGKEVHDYIHVADVARANVLAMGSDVSGESMNVCTGVATTLNDVVNTLLKVMKSDLRPEYRTPTQGVRASVGTHLAFSREKIERLLGWKPEVLLEEGIRRLVAWCEQRDAAKRNG
ncbi:NAD-dependent epimerase/dehydratase family protein [Bordetella tumulicola]|uniref:NAD-dependent epimerase/dehydratase family protein n=1 Tax=Bordetella tumulicola TaxID=1649133 RepID=UPI0039F128AC